jgi:hypothetical protein
VSDEANMKINVKDTKPTTNVLFLVLFRSFANCDDEGDFNLIKVSAKIVRKSASLLSMAIAQKKMMCCRVVTAE